MRKAMLVALVLAAAIAAPLVVIAQDPVKVDAKHYKVEFENDQVRVLRITYGPGEKSVMHEHPGAARRLPERRQGEVHERRRDHAGAGHEGGHVTVDSRRQAPAREHRHQAVRGPARRGQGQVVGVRYRFVRLAAGQRRVASRRAASRAAARSPDPPPPPARPAGTSRVRKTANGKAVAAANTSGSNGLTW